MKLGSAAIGLAVGGTRGGDVAEAATRKNWLQYSEVELADNERAAYGAVQACNDKACRAHEEIELRAGLRARTVGTNYFLDVARQWLLTLHDKADVAKA